MPPHADYQLLVGVGTPVTAPASPATPPPQPHKVLEEADLYTALSVRLRLSVRSTLQSRYFYANLVYCAYCTGMLCIDFVDYGKEFNDRLYYIFGVVHFANAWMYWWAWKGRSWRDPIVYPEYMNVLGAALYLWSAALYHKEAGPRDAATLQVHWIETSAAAVEWLACVGWLITWHLTYLRVPGRGYTLDDPDVWAIITIFAGATVYVVYNVQILQHPEWYETHQLYFYGDVFYAMNGFLYLLASLRDDGWFWFMPLAGGFPSPAGQALMYRVVYAAEKKQRIQEALALMEGNGEEDDGGRGKVETVAAAVVALIAPEEADEEGGIGIDI